MDVIHKESKDGPKREGNNFFKLCLKHRFY